MKKEEILEMSRKDNKNKDLAEIEIENKGAKIAAIGLLILATIYYILEIVIDGNTNYGFYSIIGLYCAIVYGYKAIKLKKRLDIFCAIIWLLVTVLAAIQYIEVIMSGAI